MTEIITNLHQVGAHELDQLSSFDLIIDMGGITTKVFANALLRNSIDRAKEDLNTPVLLFEIDEVEDAPFRNYREKINQIKLIARIGSTAVQLGDRVCTLCLAGQNRSGLMTCLIMIASGLYDAQEAIDIVQSKRPMALNNKQIRDFILLFQRV